MVCCCSRSVTASGQIVEGFASCGSVRSGRVTHGGTSDPLIDKTSVQLQDMMLEKAGGMDSRLPSPTLYCNRHRQGQDSSLLTHSLYRPLSLSPLAYTLNPRSRVGAGAAGATKVGGQPRGRQAREGHEEVST